MADLLAQWLNEEVGLSKNVQNFEDDFASGYLLGELLYKFNQQPDFQNFSTKNATSHFVMNFEKLEPTLRSLNVQFNSKTVERIMSRERGQSLRLLYQLKMVLEKVYPPADISIVAKTGTFGDNQPAQRIAMSKPKYDEVSHTFFKQRLGKLNRAQKDIDLEAHQKKYETEMNRQAAMAEKLDRQDVANDSSKMQELRRIQINKLQRNAGFMEEWLAKGVDDWKLNMTTKQTREATQLEFDFTQAEKYNKLTQLKLQEAQDEVQDGIAAFERNLRARGISTKVTKEGADRAINETLSGKPWRSATVAPTDLTFKRTFQANEGTKKGNFTLTSTGLKHRTKKTVTDSQRNEREKRRRRLINGQGAVLVDLEYQTREEHVTGLMKRQSRQERELDYESWRTTQCKNIIVENRKLRETQYERRRVYDVEIGVEKEQKLIAEMQVASTREMGQMLQRTAELKVYEKQYKLKQRTELCAGLMDTIFDIADEAYNHMQDLDAKESEPTNWNNWLKLFVHKQKVAGTMAELLSGENGPDQSAAQTQLDESELHDYLKNEGQWPTSLVSEVKLNLADILNPKVEAAAPVKGGKPAGKAAAQVEVVFEEGDLEVAETPANNFIFGDVIDQLIKLHYPQRPDLKHPPTPNWLALKVCLVGYPFSGKKTQAALINQKYGLDVFVMEELVQEAIDFKGETKYTQPSAPAEREEGEGSDFDALSEDDLLQKDVNEEMLAIGDLIRKQLLNGEEISDELYVRLFICKLRTAYAYKCPITKRREQKAKASRYVDINIRIGEIAQEIQREDLPKKQKKQLADEQAALEIELAEMETLQTNGWVLVDFPCSYAQAKLLEEALSGYKPHEELEPTDREKASQEALLLVQPHPQSEATKTLIPSGLDAVIWFDCPVKEALRRSDGRRFDSQDLNAHYHVFDRQPPVDQAPLCERLLALSEDNNCVSGLPDRFVAFDQNTSSMQRWLKQFGDEEKNRILLCILSAESPVAEVQSQIQGSLELVLEHRQERYENTRDELALKIQTCIDQEKKQLEIVVMAENSQMSSDHQISQQRMSPSLSQSKSGGAKHLAMKHGSQDQALGSVFTQESVSAVPHFARNNIEAEFRPTLIKLWHELSRNYCSQMKSIFGNMRRTREVSAKGRAIIQQKFLTFLHRLDNKQELLDSFVRDFNQFSDEFPDLREDPSTKEELHQRCDVLSDELWEIVEERKEQNTEERKKIMESGRCENGLEFITMCALQLMQAELDKFKASIQIIHDYYFAIEEKPTHEITQATTCELAFEGDDMPVVELIAEGADLSQIQAYSYPKLDKLLQQALKNQAVPDVTAITANAAADKKGGKPPAKGKGASVAQNETETLVVESSYVQEMKESVKVEKAILRYRLVQIRNWTLGCLQHRRQTALEGYKKFDDWIQVAQKTEMDTIEEMCQIIKIAIEDESKVQLELRIKFMDFTVDHSILNYINPPVPKLDSLEEFSTQRFSIPQLHSLCSELEHIAASTGDLMPIKELMNLLLTKFRNSICFGGNSSALPESWNPYGLAQINQMVRNIDSKNTGYINWRSLVTYLILLKSSVPSAKEISRIEKMLGEQDVDEETFVKGSYWFDATETSKDRENAIVFERVKLIKGLLFKAHSTEQGSLNVTRFATALGQISQRAANEQASFEQVLFSKVRI